MISVGFEYSVGNMIKRLWRGGEESVFNRI